MISLAEVTTGSAALIVKRLENNEEPNGREASLERERLYRSRYGRTPSTYLCTGGEIARRQIREDQLLYVGFLVNIDGT